MLDWLINRDVANGKIGITVYDVDSDEVLFSKSLTHGNFFNISVTNRKVSSLKSDAVDWANENGYSELAEELSS